MDLLDVSLQGCSSHVSLVGDHPCSRDNHYLTLSIHAQHVFYLDTDTRRPIGLPSLWGSSLSSSWVLSRLWYDWWHRSEVHNGNSHLHLSRFCALLPPSYHFFHTLSGQSPTMNIDVIAFTPLVLLALVPLYLALFHIRGDKDAEEADLVELGEGKKKGEEDKDVTPQQPVTATKVLTKKKKKIVFINNIKIFLTATVSVYAKSITVTTMLPFYKQSPNTFKLKQIHAGSRSPCSRFPGTRRYQPCRSGYRSSRRFLAVDRLILIHHHQPIVLYGPLLLLFGLLFTTQSRQEGRCSFPSRAIHPSRSSFYHLFLHHLQVAGYSHQECFPQRGELPHRLDWWCVRDGNDVVHRSAPLLQCAVRSFLRKGMETNVGVSGGLCSSRDRIGCRIRLFRYLTRHSR